MTVTSEPYGQCVSCLCTLPTHLSLTDFWHVVHLSRSLELIHVFHSRSMSMNMFSDHDVCTAKYTQKHFESSTDHTVTTIDYRGCSIECITHADHSIAFKLKKILQIKNVCFYNANQKRMFLCVGGKNIKLCIGLVCYVPFRFVLQWSTKMGHSTPLQNMTSTWIATSHCRDYSYTCVAVKTASRSCIDLKRFFMRRLRRLMWDYIDSSSSDVQCPNSSSWDDAEKNDDSTRSPGFFCSVYKPTRCVKNNPLDKLQTSIAHQRSSILF